MRLSRLEREQMECIRIRAQGLADGLELAIEKGRIEEKELCSMIRLANDSLTRLCELSGEDADAGDAPELEPTDG